jgi:hypothetical protein
MDFGANGDGELLQRALDGERVSEPGILELVAVLHAVQAVDQAGLAPRAEFVSDLRARLLDDGSSAAVPVEPVEPVTPPDGDGGSDGTISVLRVAARPLKFLAAAAAAVLVLGGAVGFASRSAVPGDALYGVKQLLDRAAVQLAGSRYEEGLTYLAQAQEHITEARNLVDGGSPSTHDLDTAYDSAADATRRAQTILLEVYRSEGRTDALSELSDFYARAIPQVDAMRSRVPAESLPAWQRLRDLLGAGQVAGLHELASCAACGDRAVQAGQLLRGLDSTRPAGTTGSTTTSTTGGAAIGGTSATGTPRPSASLPRPPLPSATLPGGGPPRAPLPSVPLPSVSVPSVPRGSAVLPGGVTLPSGTINLPGAGAGSTSIGGGGGGVALPGATVSLPRVSATSQTVKVGGGGITMPGATIPVPTVVVPLATVTVPLLQTKLPTKLLP